MGVKASGKITRQATYVVVIVHEKNSENTNNVQQIITISMPASPPNLGKKNPYLEGGDVLLNGRHIYVGYSGRASNDAGIEWLKGYLGPDYQVNKIKLKPNVLHLDCAIALIRPGLGLMCPEWIDGELPESLKDWEFITVTPEQADKLACNILVLEPNKVIADKQHHDIAEKLREKGVEVIEIPYDKVAFWGGAFRCSHHPLRRESKLR